MAYHFDVTKTMLFGADPECFVFDTKKERYVCPADFLPGTKDSPHPVQSGAVQVDGMAAEFNINPANTYEEFESNFRTVIRELKSFLPKGHALRFVPSVTFEKEVMDAAPLSSKMLGCSPDLNAWTGQLNPPPNAEEFPLTRCAGGHVHLGWTEGADVTDPAHIQNCLDLVKQLDWYLGAWSVRKDSDKTRRGMYGKAGACRIKPYGVEYRVLSNFWCNNATLREQVWNRMQYAIDQIRKNFLPETRHDASSVIDLYINGEMQTATRDAFVINNRRPILSL